MKCKQCNEVKPVADFKPVTIDQCCNKCKQWRICAFNGYMIGDYYNQEIRQYYRGIERRPKQLDAEDTYEYYLIYQLVEPVVLPNGEIYRSQTMDVIVLVDTGDRWAMHHIQRCHYDSGLSYSLLAGCENEDAGTDSGKNECVLEKADLQRMLPRQEVSAVWMIYHNI
jgi:hypothetical protein